MLLALKLKNILMVPGPTVAIILSQRVRKASWPTSSDTESELTHCLTTLLPHMLIEKGHTKEIMQWVL